MDKGSKLGCLFYIVLFTGIFLFIVLKDKFTSIDGLERRYIIEQYSEMFEFDDADQITLAKYLYESSKVEKRTGAICFDGWVSSATGRGACSHHGGVAKWMYETVYLKSYEQCLSEARKIKYECRVKAYETSWIDDIEDFFSY